METKYVFRNELKDNCLEQWIRRMLEIHQVMNLEGLCRYAGSSGGNIRPALDTMIERGEVKRLRPIYYENDDMDFFELSSPPPTPKARVDRGRWLAGIRQAINMFVADAEDTSDYNHLDSPEQSRRTNNILTMS